MTRQQSGGPSGSRAVGRPPQRPATRLFTLADAEAIANPDVVSRNASLFSIGVRVLIDPGSNRSFVGPRVSMHADKPLDTLIYVMTPLKKQLCYDEIYRSCVLIVGATQLELDLILLDL